MGFREKNKEEMSLEILKHVLYFPHFYTGKV
jgi:hypothetical protein